VSFTSAPYRKKFSKLQVVGRQKNSENHSEISLFQLLSGFAEIATSAARLRPAV
jgi:hypothetical protein